MRPIWLRVFQAFRVVYPLRHPENACAILTSVMTTTPDRSTRRLAMPWQWQRLGWICASLAVVLASWFVVAAQPSANQSITSVRAAAEKAFRAGRYDEVETLTQNSGTDDA